MHPLHGAAFRFGNFKGFSQDQPELVDFAPISVLVGRNNSGKSAIIDALAVVLSAGKSASEQYNRFGSRFSIEVRSDLTEGDLRPVFRSDRRSNGVRQGQRHTANLYSAIAKANLLRSSSTPNAGHAIYASASVTCDHQAMKGALIKFGLVAAALAYGWSRQPSAAQLEVEQSAYYPNCAAARAAGAAPMYRGQPGYRDDLDGDGDGIACEPYRGSD